MADFLNCDWECNACALKKLDYFEGLEKKRELVSFNLGHMIGDVPLPFYEKNKAYRNKVIMHASYKNEWRLGIIQNEEVIDIVGCPVHAGLVNTVATVLKKHLPPPSQFPLHCVAISGLHLVFILKTGFREIQSYTPFIPLDAILATGIKSIWLHANAAAGRKIFHKDFLYKVCGETILQDNDGIYYHPLAFRQLQTLLHGQSIQLAGNFFNAHSQNAFVDLYCGIGISMKKWEEYGGAILGVEMSGKALECAALNSPSAHTLRGSVEQRSGQISSFITEVATSVMLYVNPPRGGLGQVVVQFIKEQQEIENLVYLSCNPRSLKHDLAQLSSCFEMHGIDLFDFFPYTRHIETQLYLKRK